MPELASWFGFEDAFDTAELGEMGCRPDFIYDDDVGDYTPVLEGETLFPCMEAICMGWSWALYFANEAVAARVAAATPGGVQQAMRERHPTPEVAPGRCVTGTYVDNVQLIGGRRSDAVGQMDAVVASFKAARIPFDRTEDDGVTLQTIGVVYHWSDRRLRHVSRRVWRCYLATRALLRRRVLTGHTLECWLGHVVNLFQLNPECLASLSAVYSFVGEAQGRPLRVWPSVRGELRCVLGLLFLGEADLSAKYADQVYCGDSSGRGYALHVTKASPTEMREAWRWREKWRTREAHRLEGPVLRGDDLCSGYVRGGVVQPGLGSNTA